MQQLSGQNSMQTEQLYYQTFLNAPNCMGIVDLNGRWIDVNDALCRLIGYLKQELIGKRYDEVPETAAGADESFRFEQALRRRFGRYRIEKNVIHKNGSPIKVSFAMSLVKDAREQPLWFVVHLNDLSGQEKHEQERHMMQELYRAYMGAASEAFILLDPEGRALEVNGAFCQMYGYEPEELLGRQPQLTPQEYGHHTAYLLETVTSGKPVQRFETVKRRKDGTRINVSVTMAPIRDKDGQVVGLAAAEKDITLQNKLWQTVRESEETFNRLLEHMQESFIAAREGSCIYINGAGLKLLGADSPDDLIGRPLSRFIHDCSAVTFAERFMQAMKGLMGGPSGMTMVRTDGTPIAVEVVFIPALFGEEPAVHMLIRDMTERIKAEEMYRLSDKMNAVGQMAAGLAHEIRNPLTAIKGFVQLAEWQLPQKSEYFSIIKSEIERIDSITSEMLMLAKPNPSKIRMVDLSGVMKAVHSLLESQAILAGVEIVFEPGDSAAWVHCDENQIKQVFVNLIKNAIEAMKTGGRITIATRCKNGWVYAEVRDEGCGIPEDLLARIGQPFFTTKEKGTGLGLMVSYKIIENHRGAITVASRKDAGTTFTVRLPEGPSP